MSIFAAVRLLAEESTKTETPNSWLPESYEIIWGGLATLVIAFALTKFAIPLLRKALTDRTARIQRDLDSSAAALADAEVAEYEAALAGVRAEAQGRIDAAVRTLESERSTRLAAVNAELAAQRASAAAELDAAKAAVRNDIAAATRDVVTAAAQRVLGAAPDTGAVGSAVERALSAEVVR